MPAPLRELLNYLNLLFNSSYNTVLCNLYMNGESSIGWHSDNEPELGNQPSVVSLSLGAPRVFSLRQIANRAVQRHVVLKSGSLLVMLGDTQLRWQHAILPSGSLSARINITFRQIVA